MRNYESEYICSFLEETFYVVGEWTKPDPEVGVFSTNFSLSHVNVYPEFENKYTIKHFTDLEREFIEAYIELHYGDKDDSV